MRPLLCAALPLLAGACIDFVAPEPRVRAAEPPGMVVNLAATDPGGTAGGDSLRVRGDVFRGRDADSMVLRGLDDSLRVAGRAVFARTHPDIDPAYASLDTVLVLPALAGRVIPVQLPALALKGVPRRELNVGFASRAGYDALTVAAGEPVELVLRPPADGTEPGVRSWSVTMRRGDALASVHVTGVLPERITIPAVWVPADTASVLNVTVDERRHWGLPAAADSSRVHLSAGTTLNWLVRIVPR